MAILKAVLASLEDVAEEHRNLYVEKDGKFLLDAEGVEDVSGLKSALSKERKARQDADSLLRKFREAGIDDPDKVVASMAKLEELQAFDPLKEADKIAAEKMKAREAQLIAKHQQEIAAERKVSEGYLSHLKREMVDSKAVKALAEAKGAVELLLPHIRDRARLRMDDSNRPVVEILDEAGNPRIGDANGSLMTIEQYVQEMKASPVYGRAFDGTNQKGSGGPSGEKPITRDGVRYISREELGRGVAKLEDIAAGKVQVQE